MTSDLAFTIFRLGYLVILWIMVLGALRILRLDIFGTVVTPRGKGRRRPSRASRRARRTNPGGHVHSLLLTGGPLVGSLIPLGTAPVSIGRSPGSTLVLEDEYASSQHARLTPRDGQWWVEDLGSRNGTYVNDERLAEPRVLSLGMKIRIGHTIMEAVE